MMRRPRFHLFAGLLLVVASTPSLAALEITPITWNVIGLDSNKPSTEGPDTFPVGARVCNVSGSPSGPLTATFVRDGAVNSFITLLTNPVLTADPLPAGGSAPSQYTILNKPANCFDFYYEVQIARTKSAHDTRQGFHITVTDGVNTVQTPAGRELFVEKLISQSRNGVTSFTGPATLYVGQTVTYTVNGFTAPGGYEQVEFAPVLPVLFQMLEVSVNLAVPGGGVNSTVYADACGWENDPTHPDYWRMNNSDECHLADNYTGGKAGGNPVSLTYIVKALSAGSGTMTNVWYDYSGSSFHYNNDVGTGANALPFTILEPTAVTGTKTFSAPTIGPGGVTSTLTITLNNPNPAPSQDPAGIPGVEFTDVFPTAPGAMTLASTSTTNTCGGTLTDNAGGTLDIGDAGIQLTGGTIPWNGSCTITVEVTASEPGLYSNTIPAGGLTTSYGGGSTNDTAITGEMAVIPGYKSVYLGSDADGSGGPSVGDTLTWSVFYNNPANAAGTTEVLNFQVTDTVAAGMTVAGAPTVTYEPAACSSGVANSSFDGSADVNLFAAGFTLNEGCTVRVDYDTTVTSAGAGTTLANQASGSGTDLAAVLTDNIDDTTAGLPAGVSPTSGSVAQTQVAAISPTTVDIPLPPTVAKTFNPSTIPVGGTSQLTITLTNPNASAITLTSALTDTLPTGLVVATPNGLGGTCTLGSVTATAGSGTISYASGASIPAGSCTIQVDVLNSASTGTAVSNAGGVYSNTIAAGALQTTAGSNAAAATDDLSVIAGHKSVRVQTDADSSGLAAATVGDTLEWSVFYSNPAGGTDIASFQATDTIAANMSLVGSPTVSYSPASCSTGTANGGFDGGAAPNLFASAFTLTAGCTVRVDYSVTVDSGAAGTSLLNQASATGTGLAATPTDNIDNATTGLPAGVTPTANSIAQVQVAATTDATAAPVLQPPTVSKAFSPQAIPVLGTSQLTINLGNPNASAITLNAALTDSLPTGVVVATPNGLGGTCTLGSVTATAGSGSITYASGASVPAGGCTIQVDVSNSASTGSAVSDAGGVYLNSIPVNALQTTAGNNTAQADADLYVVAGYKSVSIENDADSSGSATSGDTLQWSVFYRNPTNGTAINNFQVTDTLGANMTVTAAPTVSYTPGGCSAGTANGGYAGSGNLFSAPFTFNAGCTVRVDYSVSVDAGGTTLSNQASATGTGLVATLTDNIDNTTTGLPAGVVPAAGSIAQTQAAATIDPTTVVVPSPPTIAKAFSPDPIGTGQASTLTITLTNPNTFALTGAVFTDTFPTSPGQMYIANPTNASTTCGGTLEDSDAADANTTIDPGDFSIRLDGGTIPASGSCTVTVNVTSNTEGAHTNTIPAGALTSSGGPSQAAASDTLQVNPPVTVLKSAVVISDPTGSATPKAIPGAVVEYTVLMSNTGAVNATSVAMTDAIPTNTTYVDNSLIVDGVACPDDEFPTGPADTGDGCSAFGGINAILGTVNAGDSVPVVFRVTVN